MVYVYEINQEWVYLYTKLSQEELSYSDIAYVCTLDFEEFKMIALGQKIIKSLNKDKEKIINQKMEEEQCQNQSNSDQQLKQ